MLRDVINIISILLGLLIFLFVAYIGFSNLNKDLSQYSYYENLIVTKEVKTSDNDSEIFSLRLKEVNNEFSYYRISEDYNDLQNSIDIGDRIKIFYDSNADEKNPNSEIIQIEKNGKILLAASEHKTKYIILFIIGILSVTYMLYLGYRYLRKKSIENTIPPIF
ncbi:hypothetical protein BST97_03350 [Nonlabens spongiae]|uniref:DUF3592 domain-containing protein n=1 Tax=Nonlabens spongiae TaxID=331648 RepID=A0A1W6MHX9_9FLAO|nr:hypothetical protein [Nonlabens spongiae]ARN77106.1 hypothetical protein BST97_03350 [Nonlabens spongiae]